MFISITARRKQLIPISTKTVRNRKVQGVEHAEETGWDCERQKEMELTAGDTVHDSIQNR